MQSPQTRQQRRAAERKARKLARKATQPLAASAVPVPAQSSTQAGVAGPSAKHGFSPELEDEFSPELLSRASSIYEQFERKAAAVPQISAKREIIPDAAATCPPARTRINRANAQHSTGPRTSAGKLASSRNSLKHGLAGPQLIIPGEDRTAFDALLAGLLDEHRPASAPKNCSSTKSPSPGGSLNAHSAFRTNVLLRKASTRSVYRFSCATRLRTSAPSIKP